MNGGVYIISYKTLREKNRILVVVAFPGHEADKRALAKTNLSTLCRRAICNYLFSFYVVTVINYRTLVDTGSLVTSCEFKKWILGYSIVIIISD